MKIDPAFLATSEPLGELGLCHARLQADARFPWIVLIPRLEGAREIEDLDEAQRAQLMAEVVAAGRAVRAIGEVIAVPVAKLNVGQLGNVTPQLHIHVVGRRPGDRAWPGPVWGHGEAVAYAPEVMAAALVAGRETLKDLAQSG